MSPDLSLRPAGLFLASATVAAALTWTIQRYACTPGALQEDASQRWSPSMVQLELADEASDLVLVGQGWTFVLPGRHGRFHLVSAPRRGASVWFGQVVADRATLIDEASAVDLGSDVDVIARPDAAGFVIAELAPGASLEQVTARLASQAVGAGDQPEVAITLVLFGG